MRPITLLNNLQFQLTINRLCYQIIEHHDDFKDSVIIGLQPRGIQLSRRIQTNLSNIEPQFKPLYGEMDITLYRDDFGKRELSGIEESTIEFSIKDKRVILIDDVLYTGRTIRAGLDALLDYGRPSEVELLVLIDRRFSRHLPIEANYIGKKVDSIASQKVKVQWKEIEGEDQVILFTEE